MAHVEIRLVLDGGAEMTFFETSAYPITDGPPAVMLAQAAYIRLARACGVAIGTADEPAAVAEPGESDPPPPGQKAAAAAQKGS